ncbi:MAG: hypothetical protein H7066_13820 [Cytophagaceae bacterium]|nr:hypothetical protein [Gemmatimonadaceae bacterium]
MWILIALLGGAPGFTAMGVVPRAVTATAVSATAAVERDTSLFEVRITEASPSPNSHRAVFGTDTLALEATPVLTDADFTSVEPVQGRARFYLRFSLTEAAAERLYQRTCAARGRTIVFLLEGRVVNALLIAGAISRGSLVEARVPPADVPRLTSMIRFQWSDPATGSTTPAPPRPRTC